MSSLLVEMHTRKQQSLDGSSLTSHTYTPLLGGGTLPRHHGLDWNQGTCILICYQLSLVITIVDITECFLCGRHLQICYFT